MARKPSSQDVKRLKARIPKGQRGIARIYAGKGKLRKGIKLGPQKRAVRRSIIKTPSGGLVSGRTGEPLRRARVVRALKPNSAMAVYNSTRGRYKPSDPLATAKTGRCLRGGKMRVSQRGALTCRGVRRVKLAEDELSPYQRSSKATLRKLSSTTISPIQRMKIAGKVWKFQQNDGLSHGAAFDRAMMDHRGMARAAAAPAPRRRRARAPSAAPARRNPSRAARR